MKKIAIILILGVAAAALSGCASKRSSGNLSADVGYVNTASLPATSGSVNRVRTDALSEAATTLGARGALAWRSQQIDQALSKQSSYLDQVFNFSQLIIKNSVLPPVLEESNNNVNVASTKSIRMASKTYKIVSPARFVSTPPNWRNYLMMNYKKPDMPDRTLLPTTKAEAEIWNKSIREGWKQGLTQANTIFARNLARLKRDYNGIVLYRKLLAQNMVSAPYIAKAELGVTGDGTEIRINDRVIRITKDSSLNPNSQSWNPVIVPGSDE